MKTQFFLGLFAFVGIPLNLGLDSKAWASFEARDAEQVDREEFATEYYLDTFSYRYTLGMESALKDKEASYGTSFGSVDGQHFYRLENLKVEKRHEDTTFAFVSKREEDLVEKRLHSEFRLMQRTNESFAVLAKFSSDFYKKWCDIGFGFAGFVDSKKRYGLEVSLIDSFYNIKEVNPNDRYLNRVWNLQASVVPLLTEKTSIELSGEVDTPVRWKRTSEGYSYTERQESAHLKASHWTSENLQLWVKTSYEHKDESKTFFNETLNSRSLDQREQSLSLNRHTLDARVGVLKKSTESTDTHELTVGHLTRDADYDATQASALVRNAPISALPPARSGKLATISISQLNDLEIASSTSNYFRTGASASWSILKADPARFEGADLVTSENRIEAKFYTGWEYRLGKSGMFGFHISWDLDNWTRKLFRGQSYNTDWDGGNAQFAVAL